MVLKNLSKAKKGLTLVEILVVILIIAILITALIPRVTSALDKAKETQIRTDFRNFSLAAESVLREYAGFNGVPLIDASGKNLKTIGEQFWNNSTNVQEEGTKVTVGGKEYKAAVTQSLIKAVNRYLETSYQFDTNINNATFGKSAALDPWKKPYEIYFVSRDVSQADDLNTDKIYVTCNGKTQNQNYPDYMLLCEYFNGEVRSATAGFGDVLSTGYTVFAGTVNNKQYVLLGSLFRNNCATSGLANPIDNPELGNGTLFNMGTTKNVNRLFVESTSKLQPITAIDAN